MTQVPGWRRLFRLEGPGGRLDEDVNAELEYHIQERTEELMARGMGEREARATVLREFGDVDAIRDACRAIDERRFAQMRRSEFARSVAADVRFSLRTLRRNPIYTAVALLTLALGIGANTAIFSVVHGVLLSPLPYAEGHELVLLRQSAPGSEIANMNFSAQEIFDYRDQTQTLNGVVEYHSLWFTLLGRAEPERVLTGIVSANFFDVLGVKPLLGRTFREGEDEPGAEPVLVLSYEYWQRSHGADPEIVGKTFEMNDKIHTVVGVLPPVPQYPRHNDVYMPVAACPFRSSEGVISNRAARMMPNVFGRLKSGVTLQQAEADVAAIAARMAEEHPEAYAASSGFTARLDRLGAELTERARPTLLILLAMAGLVLLLACANVANLALARLMRRERELAVRAALGAGRGRLLRQLLTESTLLALVGGGLGLLLAAGGLDLLIAFAGRFTPRAAEVEIDTSVLLFTLIVSVAAGLFFGALPALSGRRDLVTPLKEAGSRTATEGGRQRLRGTLVVAQVAISFVLLIAAGLMTRSLFELHRVDPGFDPVNVLAMEIDLDFTRYNSSQERIDFFAPILERVYQLPGVRSAAVARTFPLNPSGQFNTRFEIEGRPTSEGELRPLIDFRVVGEGFFQTVGVPLLHGRDFTALDHGESPSVALISQTAAMHYWPDEDPLGQRISSDGGQTWVTVVGVVGDVREELAEEPFDLVYVPYAQFPTRQTNLLVRTTANPLATARAVIDAVYEVDPEQPVANIRTLEHVRSESLASSRLTATLLGLFAALALAVTVAGIAGVIAFSVSQRTHEFGIRMALGAGQSRVLELVMRQGMTLTTVGLIIGLAGSIALSRAMTGLLYGIEPTDPLTYTMVALVLFAVAAIATLLPARRATAVDPMLALRAD